jgi:hypothetical protein
VNRHRSSRIAFALVVLALLTGAVDASACAACAGKSNDAMFTAYLVGAISLIALILSVLGAITGFFIHTARRAAKLAATQAIAPFPNTR